MATYPLERVLDGRHRQVWQGALVTVEQRLSAGEDAHQCLAYGHIHVVDGVQVTWGNFNVEFLLFEMQ